MWEILNTACNIDDSRPVSMVGWLYKIISKILARRLRLVMGDEVSESQTDFVHGKNISDGLITTNEAIHWLMKHKVLGTLFQDRF